MGLEDMETPFELYELLFHKLDILLSSFPNASQGI